MSTLRSPANLLGATYTLDDVGPAHRGRAHPSLIVSTVLLFPAAGLVVGVVIYSLARVAYTSLTGPDGFVGLEHFRTALDVEGVGGTFVRSFGWAVAVPAVVTMVALVMARSLPRRREDPTGVKVLLAVIVAPIGLPLVVTGVAFRLLYDPDPQRGLVTDLANLLPGDADSNALLGPRWITLSLMSAFVWAWLGLAVVVFRTALDRLQPDLGEAVRAGGGSRWRAFVDGEWRPLVRRTYWIMFALIALATVRAFDLILVMAPGSVVDEASVLALLQWQTSAGVTTGPAAALGVLWMLVVVLGVAVAALWSRQSWPPPVVPKPGPGPRARIPVKVGPLLAAAPVVVWLLPVLVLVGTALHDARPAALDGWWEPPFGTGSVTGAFAWDRGLLRSMGLTFTLAVFVTGVVLVLGLLAAYALAWIGPPGAHLAGIVLLCAAVVPIQVIALPITDVLERLGLAGTPAGLALVHAALGLPVAVLLLRNALSDLPPTEVRRVRLESSRKVEGAQQGNRLRRTALWRSTAREAWTVRSLATEKGMSAVLVAVALLEFVQVWNDLVVGLLFGGADTVPLGVLVQGEARQFVSNSGPLAAAALVAALVPVMLMALGYRRVVEGLVTGTEK
jgi:alpha-glucoside transport system permease protein